MYSGVKIETVTKAETTVTINGHNINEAFDLAVDMAHCILEETSHMRNTGLLNEDASLSSEGLACRFLDMVGD